MQFSTSTDTLRSGLEWVAQSLPTRTVVPILAAVILEVDPARGEGVTLRAFDYELASTVTIPATVGDGKRLVAVSGRLLTEIAKVLPRGDVQVAIDGAALRLSAGSATFSLPLMPEEDYPALPSPPQVAGSVDTKVFVRAVRQVAWAASRDTAMPVLTTTQVTINPRKHVITLVATDRYRLAIKHITYTPSDPDGDSFELLPASSLDKLARGIGTSESVTIAAEAGESTVGFTSGNRAATFNQLQDQGNYPPALNLVPHQFQGVATVPTRELLEVVKRVAIVSDTGGCQLAFDTDTVTVSSGGNNGGQASEQLPVEYEGEPLTVTFRHNYLIDVLTHIDTERVTVCLQDAIKAAKFCPASDTTSADSGDGGREELVYVVMPLRVTS